MEKKEFITNRFKKILLETFEDKAKEMMEKMDLYKDASFNKPGTKENEFDYVQEREMCKECGGYKGGDIMEGEMCECGSMNEGLKGGQKKLDVAKPFGKLTRSDFDKLRKGVKKHMKEYTMGDDELETVKPYGDFSTDSPKIKPGKNKVKNVGDDYQRKVSKQFDDYELEESETEEGNAFTGMLEKTPKGHSFKMGGKKYKDRSSLEETLYRISTNGESALFTENEIIDLIENIVNEEKVKSNLKNSTTPKGMSEYERVHKADKKEEDQYFKEVRKKMDDYTKNMSDKGSKYEMKETQKFPTGNGGVKKKYTPSEAVDDYNDAFSYPGQTNLRYEIKPNDEWMEANLVGSSKTGNAQVDEDGNALGNVVPSKVGEKFLDNYKNNYYGDEQANASYKRQAQPIEQAGEHTESGSLKSKKGGKKTAQSILNKVDESITPKEQQKLSEEFIRMQQLIGYDHKTQ
jgi:hypothetical protein